VSTAALIEAFGIHQRSKAPTPHQHKVAQSSNRPAAGIRVLQRSDKNILLKH